MEFDIIQLNKKKHAEKYEKLLKTIKNYSPYYLLSFIKYFSNGLSSLICFVGLTKEGGIILLPGYFRNIPSLSGYYDFTSPYGYSGPVFTENISETHLKIFWNKIDVWYNSNNIVSEFIRFSLNINYQGYSGLLIPTLANIKGIIIDEKNQWINFERKVRKNISRAQREYLISKVISGQEISDNYIDEFYKIYFHTMKRNNAESSFFYSEDIFKKFIKNNNEKCALCSIYDFERCVSAELLLLSEDSVFSFLGGTLDDSFSKRPNDFLKYSVINWARLHNKKYYILGGGYGSDDGIFNFKKSFFPNNIVQFYTGRKIINEKIYNCLIENKFGRNIPETNFFPLYRFKL